MKRIPLTQGKFAIVDEDDYEYLNQWKWFAYKNKKENTWYAGRSIGKSPNQRRLSMHRLLITPDSDVLIDHIDRNGLNNQRNNLRICTKSQNRRNSKKRIDNTSGYIGVTWRKDTESWRVQLTVDGQHIRRGGFDDPKIAAQVYNKLAKKYFGDFAVLNENI